MAGEIDNINFKVILDDTDFNDKIKADIKVAKDLNISVSQLLDLKRKIRQADAAREKAAASAAKEAAAEERLALAKQKTATEQARTAKETQRAALAQQKVATEAARTEKAQTQAANAARRGEQAIRGQSRIMREVAGIAAGYVSIMGMRNFLSALTDVTGEYETQRAALSAMLQDAPAAEAILGRIRDLALVSPFTFSELVKDVKQLSAYGIPVGQLYEDTKMLADVSAGLGVDMSRIILAYGQIRSASFLRGQELRQLTEAGLPVMDELAKKISEVEGRLVSAGDVFDRVSRRQVPFEMVRDVFRDLTSEGGKFYNMQDVLASTLEGKISNLKDAYQDMLRTVGGDNEGLLKDAVDFARKLVENYRAIGKALVGLVTAYGAYKAALIAVAAWQKLGALAENIRLIGMLRKEMGLLTATQQAFNVASSANVYVAIGAAVLGVVAAVVSFNTRQKEALRTAGEASRAYEDERAKLSALFETAKDETKAKKDRARAIAEINGGYGQYLDSVVKETDSIEALAAAYGKTTTAMREKYLEEQRAAMVGTQRADFDKAASQMWGRIGKVVGAAVPSDKAKGAAMGKLQDLIAKYGGSWSAMDIYNAVTKEIARANGNKPGNRALGSLYSDIWGFKEAQGDLNRAEASFSAFSTGFAKATAAATETVDRSAETILVKSASVADGIRRTTERIEEFERKAAGAGLTPDEVKNLQRLRQDLQDQQETYKDLTGSAYGGRGADAARDKYQRKTDDFYNRMRREVAGYELEIAAAQIEAMEEGHEKTLARMDLDHRKREQVITDNYRKELEAIEREGYDAGISSAETDARTQALTSGYQQALLAEAMVTANAYAAIDKAAADKAEESRREYLEKYGTMEEKRLVIVESFEKKIQQARKDGYEYIAKSLERERDANIYELQKQYSGLYALIFADADKLTRSQLARAIQLTREEIEKASDSGDIQRLTELYKRLREQLEKQTQQDAWGFAGIARGFRMMRDGVEEFERATDSEGKQSALSKQTAGVDLIRKSAAEVSSALSELGDALSKFKGPVGEISSMLSALASNTDNIVTAFTSKDKGQIVSSAIESTAALVSLVANQIDENRRAQEAWNDTVRQCAHEYAMLQIKQQEYRPSNIFGVENPYQKAMDGMGRYTLALDALRQKEAEMMGGRVQTGTTKVNSRKNIGKGIAAGAGAGAAIGTALGGWAMGIGTIIGTAIGSVVGGVTGWLGGKKEVAVYENLLDKYGSIIDRGNKESPFALNPQIIADYDKLDEDTKKIVDSWKDVEAEAEKALSDINENFKELCGEIGDNLYNALVDAWRKGDIYAGVDEFHDYMGKTIRDLMYKAAFASIMKPMFDELQEDMRKSFVEGGDQDITDELDRLAKKVPGVVAVLKGAMESVDAQLEEMGYSPDVTGASLGNGFKSITEDTAGLLASYLNAARADLSVIRIMQVQGWQDVKAIRALMPPVTVWDYIAKIEAHTFDIQADTGRLVQTNARILASLEAALTTEGGAPAFRALI